MPSFKLLIRPSDKLQDGTFPIYLRITHNRKASYKSTGVYVRENQWNPSTKSVNRKHPLYTEYNKHLRSFVNDAERSWIENKKFEPTTARDIKKIIFEKGGNDFFTYAETIISEYETRDQYRTGQKFRTAINRFREFVKNDDITFEDVTPAILRAFDNYLRKKYNNRTNTVHKHFRMIKRIFNLAIQDGRISNDVYPFRKYSIKLERTEKTKLSLYEIQQILKLELVPQTSHWHARNYFMFAFYNGGMRFSDVCTLRWKNVIYERLIYQMGKTGAGKNMKIVPQAKRILDYYHRPDVNPEDFIFPLLPPDAGTFDTRKMNSLISSKNMIVNKNLKKIAEKAEVTQNISFHVARHSWADYARRKGMSVYTISKILAHSSLKVTEGYLKGFDTESVDAEYDKLFSDGADIWKPMD